MTTYSRRVSDSVSVSEMLHMRNVLGLSNGEIAQRLGCCTATVKRMIGVHPEGKKAKRKSKPLPPPCCGQSAGDAEAVFPAAVRGGAGYA